jgi:hypothetical protein
LLGYCGEWNDAFRRLKTRHNFQVYFYLSQKQIVGGSRAVPFWLGPAGDAKIEG